MDLWMELANLSKTFYRDRKKLIKVGIVLSLILKGSILLLASEMHLKIFAKKKIL